MHIAFIPSILNTAYLQKKKTQIWFAFKNVGMLAFICHIVKSNCISIYAPKPVEPIFPIIFKRNNCKGKCGLLWLPGVWMSRWYRRGARRRSSSYEYHRPGYRRQSPEDPVAWGYPAGGLRVPSWQQSVRQPGYPPGAWLETDLTTRKAKWYLYCNTLFMYKKKNYVNMLESGFLFKFLTSSI